jgi:2-polyprenyl-3-methyl-5-hydroxy-6-metoxy-1,4-benzoquinol methylase
MSLSVRELIADRWHKRGLYDTAAYWDKKATFYQGLARSNWPSNTYNQFIHERQMALLDELWPEVRGMQIADVGAGTGRASLHLSRRGARVTGFDFSEQALGVARADATREGRSVEFEHQDVSQPFARRHHGAFDAVLVLGCLTLACRDSKALREAVSHLAALLKPGGQLLFVEPMHRSRLLRRILALSVPEWVTCCEAEGLRLLRQGALLFVPARFLLAFRDWPEAWVRQLFTAGERILSWSPRLSRLADYKWLLLELCRGS